MTDSVMVGELDS